MDDNISVLAHNIRFLRKLSKISQEDLAAKLKISRSNIAAYESKNVEPRLKTILEIARFFDISIKTLIDTKLTDGVDYAPFDTKSIGGSNQPQKLDIRGNLDVETFIGKSIKIKKILEGFKTFYSFKKANLQNKTQKTDKIIFDIDNFIKLIEHLLVYNERIINALSNTKKIG